MVGSSDTSSVAVNDENNNTSSSSSVSCSICLDLVVDHAERSVAKLQCGHEFHLDCIGSAFNMKGVMQCPNCRKIESGGWLFANGSTPSVPEFVEEVWTQNEDPQDFSYTEMPFGVPWCPFNGFTVHSAFEEVESVSRTSFSSFNSSYVVYVRPIPATISNSIESIDDPNISHHVNGQSGRTEVYRTHAFPTTYVPHQGWVRHHPPLSASRSHNDAGDQISFHPTTARSTGVGSDSMARPGSFVPPIRYSHGSNPRLHGRIQVSHARHPQQQASNIPSITSSTNPGFRRFSVTRGLPLLVPTNPSGGFYVLPPSGFSARTLHEPENRLPNHVHSWERNQSRFPVIAVNRDSGWGSLHHSTGGSDPSNRPQIFWPAHWS